MAPSLLRTCSMQPSTGLPLPLSLRNRKLHKSWQRSSILQLRVKTQEAPCPDAKRHKANDSQDPFVGGGKSNASLGAAASNRRGEPCLPPAPQSVVEPRRLGGMSCVSSCRTEDFDAMRRAIGLSVRSGSVGRVPDMLQIVANDRRFKSLRSGVCGGASSLQR